MYPQPETFGICIFDEHAPVQIFRAVILFKPCCTDRVDDNVAGKRSYEAKVLFNHTTISSQHSLGILAWVAFFITKNSFWLPGIRL